MDKISADDVNTFIEKLKQHLLNGNAGSLVQEVNFFNLNYQTKCFLFTGKVAGVPGSNMQQVRGSYLNVTHQKEAENELAQLRNFLDKTNEVAMVGGWELDLFTDKVTWSSVTKTIFGVEPGFIPDRGSASTFFKAGEDRARLKKGFLEAVRDGKTYDLELRVINTNGEERWTRTIGHPEFKNGKCIKVYGIFQDITNQKQAEETLKMKHE